MGKISDLFRNRLLSKTERAKKQLKIMGFDLNEGSLFLAIDRGDTTTLALLIEAGVQVEAKDDKGQTPLSRAVISGNLEAAQTLIVHGGANVDARDNAGLSAVMLAVNAGQSEILAVLINAGADVNVKNHETGQTALIMAAEKGEYPMVDLLLKNAITAEDRDARDKKGLTALFYAVTNGHTEVVRLLCFKKANVNVKNKEGQTPRILAKSAGFDEIIEILTAHGAID